MKIALIGSSPSSRWLAPFADTSWQIWACGIEDSPAGIGTSLPRIDDFFEFHANMHWPENRDCDFRFLDWLSKQPFRVWMQDQRYLKRALTFPKAECLARFGPYFFTSSTAWMMAKAMLDMEKVKGDHEIALYGTDLANSEERRAARPGVHHMIWMAEQAGITVSAPPESDIFNPPPLYGYVESTPRGRKLASKSKEMKDAIAEMEATKAEIERNIAHMQGALEVNQYHEAVQCGEPIPHSHG